MKHILLIADTDISSDAVHMLSEKLSGTGSVESISWPVTGDDLAAALDRCVSRGPEGAPIVVCPLVLMPSADRLQDLAEWVSEWSGPARVALAPLGYSPQLADLVFASLESAFEGCAGENRTLLSVSGLVETPLTFAFSDLQRLPDQIPDVGTVVPGREGGGVWLKGIRERVSPLPEATRVTFTAEGDGFTATVSAAEAFDKGLLVYSLGKAPLSAGLGGPTRLLIPGIDDRCANVKGVNLMELSGE